MAKTLAVGYTDTATSGFAGNDQTLPALNWGVDWGVQVDDPGEFIITNLTCPVDQPETFRFAQRKVANVYAGTDIDSSAYLPTKQGTSTLIELKETWVETDSEDPSYRKDIPIRVGVSMTLPSYGNVTADLVLAALLRAVGGAFEHASSTSAGIAALQRGVLKKSDI